MDNLKKETFTGFMWRLFQNLSTQIINFVVSIILARILSPDDFGIVALVTIFTNIALVFVTTGFSSSVIQKKDLSKIDLSTLFFSGLVLAVILYFVLFITAPLIASFYNEPALVSLLRVESLIIPVGSLYSIQQALIIRELKLKKSFIVGLCGVLSMGICGISMALLGFEAWSLVLSTLINYCVCCIVMWCIVDWRPIFKFSFQSFNAMFSFSVNILFNDLLNVLFNNIRSIIIGKQYSKTDLAYFNRGSLFPTVIMSQVDGAVTTVLFSSLAKFQEDWENGLRALRRAMRTSLFICTPIMAGLFAASEPIVRIVLTEKWIECVPYLRLMCVVCVTWPLSAQRHALNAKGYSSISLGLSLFQKALTILFILFTFQISIIAMITSTLFASVITVVISLFYYRKYLMYPIKDQISDILPAILLSIVMGIILYCITLFELSSISIIMLQIIIGFLSYGMMAKIFLPGDYDYVKQLIISFKNKKYEYT